MELRQLEYFVAVVEEANFTRAAERVHVAQPSVSQQIRRLERELGGPILDRSGRRVSLTEAGRAFLPYARAALAAVSAGQAAVAEVRGLITGHLTIGIVANLPVFDLPAVLAEFQRKYPGVQITLTELHADEVIGHLRTDDLDIGLVSLPDHPPADISSRLIGTLPAVLVTAPDDPLAHIKSGPLSLITDRPLITLPPSSTLRQVLESGCAQAGFRPHIRYEVGSLSMVAELTARGLGVALMPAWAVHNTPTRLHTIDIENPTLLAHVYLVSRSADLTSPAARTFLAMCLAATVDGRARGHQ